MSTARSLETSFQEGINQLKEITAVIKPGQFIQTILPVITEVLESESGSFLTISTESTDDKDHLVQVIPEVAPELITTFKDNGAGEVVIYDGTDTLDLSNASRNEAILFAATIINFVETHLHSITDVRILPAIKQTPNKPAA